MDPSELLCKMRDSFESMPIEVTKDMLPEQFQLAKIPILERKIELSDTVNLDPDSRYIDIKRYNYLIDLKAKYGSQDYTQARNQSNPFESIGNSIFMNRAAIKLANIDAIYNLTDSFGGLMKMRSDDWFTFCDIAGGPGGFTEYLLFRKSRALGFGMTLRGSLDWRYDRLDAEPYTGTQQIPRSPIRQPRIEGSYGVNQKDPEDPLHARKRFIVTYGQDGTGNLYTNWRFFVDIVRKQFVEGVNLVTGDGGFDITESDTSSGLMSGYIRQEFLSSRLLLIQILIAIRVLQPGGHFVCKVFDTVTSLSGQLLFLLGCCFKSVTIFKPISSRPANAERYLVCQELRDNILDIAIILEKANDMYTEKQNVVNLIDEKAIPEVFKIWLKSQNTLSIERQIRTGENILAIIESKSPIHPIDEYDIRKTLVIWNLPDNEMTKRSRFKIYV
jgi:cap1 methyltransferase